MSLMGSHRPLDAAVDALRTSGQTIGELRSHLAEVDLKRFHLHRALMRVRWTLDNTPNPDLRAALDELLREAGYPAIEQERAA